MILSGYSSRILEMRRVPSPDPVPPPREWVSWNPCTHIQNNVPSIHLELDTHLSIHYSHLQHLYEYIVCILRPTFYKQMVVGVLKREVPWLKTPLPPRDHVGLIFHKLYVSEYFHVFSVVY